MNVLVTLEVVQIIIYRLSKFSHHLTYIIRFMVDVQLALRLTQ